MKIKTEKKQQWPFVKKWAYRNGETAWCVDARTKEGGKRSFFPTRKLAEAHAKAERITRQNLGSTYTLETVSRSDAAKALNLLKDADCSATLVEAVRFYLERVHGNGGIR